MSVQSKHSFAKDILALSKPLVTIGVAITSLAGYVLNAIEINATHLIFLLLGVILMSAGAASFNHIIERNIDAQMQRTKDRPVASRRLSVKTSSIVGSLYLILGFIFLYFFTHPICAILGAFNATWYLIVYTPLKKHSVWAVFFGSITGVIPFFMGVYATIPSQIVPINYFVGAFLLMWQIPHFILLAYKFGDEYQKAGMANILRLVPEKVVLRIYYLWMIACVVIILTLPMLGFLEHNISRWILILIASLVMALIIRGLFFLKSHFEYKFSFLVTNLMQLTLMIILIIDKLV